MKNRYLSTSKNKSMTEEEVSEFVRKTYYNNYFSKAGKDLEIAYDIAKRVNTSFSEYDKSQDRKCPERKSVDNYRSFCISYKDGMIQDNKIEINGIWYKFSKSRDINGDIKKITIKKDYKGCYFIYLLVDNYKSDRRIKLYTGNSAGFDYGLSVLLTSSDNKKILGRRFLWENSEKIGNLKLKRNRKQKDSGNRNRVVRELKALNQKIYNQREDYQWKIANKLVSSYDSLFFETLNLNWMQKKNGINVNDLAFGKLISKIKYLCHAHEKSFHKVDQFFASSKTCSNCGTKKDEFPLSEKLYHCESCGLVMHREYNASLNILKEGLKSI